MIFIAVGLLLLIVLIREYRRKEKERPLLNKNEVVVSILLLFVLPSCSEGPQPIKIGADACSFCKMSIADNRFGGEIITKKGKIFKFDDMHCLLQFRKENVINLEDIKAIYLVNFDEPHNFIEAPMASLLKSNQLRSPMGGNVAVFSSEAKLKKAAAQFQGDETTWSALIN
jgi:copper chaperone NosL